MIEIVTQVLPHLALAMSDGGGDGGGELALLLAGPAAGAGMYWALYRYYRNTDKSHNFERDTHVEAGPVQGTEHKINEIRGTQSRSTKGKNESQHRTRVQRVG